jgi:hypothetical protein
MTKLRESTMTTRSLSADQIGARLRILRDLHRRYDYAADSESGRLYPDGTRLKRLKLSRLAVKDEIAALEGRMMSNAKARTSAVMAAE